MSVESLPLLQAARNEILSSLLARLPLTGDDIIERLETPRSTYMDRRGEGVPTIIERSVRLSGRLPDYEVIDDAELRLTIWAGGPPVVS